MLLIDVASRSLGVEVKGDLVSVIIKRNTTIPANEKETYSTCYNNQRSVNIVVYEGEGKFVKDCNKLGEFEFVKDCNKLGEFVINGIPPAPSGTPKIVVQFDFDQNGILKVDAYEEKSGNKGSITIKNV
jgi:molecular chaperone DnaK (HSP70)